MPNPANLVHETATATGTGNIAVTAVNGKQRFATAFTTGGTNVFDYFISNRDAAEWERGTGHMEDVNTLVRDEAIETSAGTTERISFSAGTKDVTNDVPALRQVYSTTIGSSGFMPTFTTTGGNELQPSGVKATTSAVFPATNDGVALGTSALKFSDLHLASGGVLQFSTEATNITHAASQLTIAASSININTSQLTVSAVTADIGSVKFTTNAVRPATNDGVALGSSALKFADLYLADGGVVNFSTGEQGGGGATITHSASQLAIAASTILVAGSVRVTTGVIQPTSNDGVALGSSALKFSDLFLASGAVLQFSTEATNITHAASALTIAASSININTSQLTVAAVTADIGSVRFTTASVLPITSEGVTLGTSSNRWAGVYTSSGVNFPAAQDASADANTLDDYEEGTFTPTFTPATTGTYTNGYAAATTGEYTKIGELVRISGIMSVTTRSSGTGSGTMGISGLPFSAGAANRGLLVITSGGAAVRGSQTAHIATGDNVARMIIGPLASTGATSALSLNDITTTATVFLFSGTYAV